MLKKPSEFSQRRFLHEKWKEDDFGGITDLFDCNLLFIQCT